MINRQLFAVIVALLLIPSLLAGFGKKVEVKPVEAAPDVIERRWNQMEGNMSSGCVLNKTHVCEGLWSPCPPDGGGADGALITWGDEPTQWAWGHFTGLDPSITYHGYIEAMSNWWTGDPANRGRLQTERSDGGGWNDERPQFSQYGWQTFDYGTFSGVSSMDLKFRSRTANPPGCADDSDVWVRRVYLTYTPACVWGSTIAPPACSQANALRGEYYRDNPIGGDRFDGGLKMVRNDAGINFDWGTGAPQTPPLCPDNFSIRWTGYVKLPQDGTWTFYTWTDDGARLWVDGVNLVDKWQDQGPTTWSGTINRNAGWYPIRFEYYENAVGAAARLSYSGPGVAQQIIPAAALRTCNAPQGPALTCSFTEISSGAIVGSGTAPDPYKIQRGTEWIKIQTTASPPDPGGGTMNFLVSLVTPESWNTIATGVSSIVVGGVRTWRLTWTGSVTLTDESYKLKAHFNGNPPWDVSDGYCYFNIVPPANAEYIISARGYITSGTRSFCWGQSVGCLLPYYPEGNLSGLNTPITAPTYDELWNRLKNISNPPVANFGVITGDGVWQINGGYTVGAEYTFPGGRENVIFINGTLTVNAEIHIPTNSAVVFVARAIKFQKGLVGFSGITDEIDGFYIAENDIDTAYDYVSGTTRRLIVNGALISTKGTVVLKRRLPDADSARYASEQIKLDPKYYVLVAPYLGEAQVSWKEVAP